MYFAIVLIVLVVGGLIYLSMNRDSATTKTTVKTSDGVDTIIISNSGSTRESFIDSPYRRCVSFDPNRPAPGWCSNLDGTDPMSYWYDVDNYDNTVPRFNVIDETTGECVNPNDCKKFTENLDSSNKLIDIKAADGTELIETIANDVYSGFQSDQRPRRNFTPGRSMRQSMPATWHLVTSRTKRNLRSVLKSVRMFSSTQMRSPINLLSSSKCQTSMR